MSTASEKAAAMAAFLAKGDRVTQCPAAEANARSLASLRREAERNADAGRGYCLNESAEDRAERAAEGRAETYAAARLSGLSVSDALDDANGVS